MIILPNPAVAEVEVPNVDEVTETEEKPTIELIFMANPVVMTSDAGELTIGYESGDDSHGLVVLALEDNGGRYISTPDSSVMIRAVDPYDAVTLAPGLGIAQPLEVVRADVLQGGGILAQELDAVVAPDNSVATLMLETGIGTYVRYGGDWQLLSDDSNSLEDMALVPVSAGAVDIWDAADNARTTVSVFDLPTSNGSDGVEFIQEPSDSDVDRASLQASGISLPEINDPADLPLAVRFASAHPQARWYVSKRAKALGVGDQVPADWGGGVVLPFATRAAV